MAAKKPAKSKSGGRRRSAASNAEFASAIRESAQQIWLAGLGAFSKAQAEGNKAFEALVKEGNRLQQTTRDAAEAKIEIVSGRLNEAAAEISRQATGSWDRLEHVFETRVERALSRLGVPTSKEVERLARRVDELNASVQALGDRPAAKKPRKRAASGTTAKKAAATKTPRKPAKSQAPAQ
ncbi:MAG: phasin family protein [Burkholderiaceae bacterium]|nr:phasin family protein [Burkholderiaceae bacterium]